MRYLHKWEIEDLLSLTSKESEPLSNVLSDNEITTVHESLRKNIIYYLNNFITFIPKMEPKSVYVNLRIQKSIPETLAGTL